MHLVTSAVHQRAVPPERQEKGGQFNPFHAKPPLSKLSVANETQAAQFSSCLLVADDGFHSS